MTPEDILRRLALAEQTLERLKGGEVILRRQVHGISMTGGPTVTPEDTNLGDLYASYQSAKAVSRE